jgi:hypothetical protein
MYVTYVTYEHSDDQHYSPALHYHTLLMLSPWPIFRGYITITKTGRK